LHIVPFVTFVAWRWPTLVKTCRFKTN